MLLEIQQVIRIDKFNMSFQGIRRIREARRQSPLLFESSDLAINGQPRPIQLNLDLKSSQLSNEARTTRDSEIKGDTAHKRTRKGSFGPASKDKEKRILVGNFLHINLDGLRTARPLKEIRTPPSETPRTDRPSKSKAEDHSSAMDRGVNLSNFELDFVVGKGGFGKVWKVRERGRGRVFAMKEMQKVKIVSKRSVHSVMNQQNLLRSMDSPFLVNMHSSFQTRQTLFLVMDYCNRGDLRYHLGNRRKFREEQARFYLACILIALQYLHARRVIHRDLKPQNLVLDDKGYLRVTDLGVSREVKPNNAEDTSGTPGYMAPQVICKNNHSYPVDFFALGVIAYEFMTGRRPYVGANRKEIRQKILAKQVQLDEIPPYGWSRQSVDFINRLIQRKAQARLGSNGIQEVKQHPFFKKMDWEKLEQKKIMAPFMPQTIEEDYCNYKECISEDTEIMDMEEYKMILRHKDTQEAFAGYDFNNASLLPSRKKSERKDLEALTHTALSIRKRK